jgi:hypothetical protein
MDRVERIRRTIRGKANTLIDEPLLISNIAGMIGSTATTSETLTEDLVTLLTDEKYADLYPPSLGGKILTSLEWLNVVAKSIRDRKNGEEKKTTRTPSSTTGRTSSPVRSRRNTSPERTSSPVRIISSRGGRNTSPERTVSPVRTGRTTSPVRTLARGERTSTPARILVRSTNTPTRPISKRAAVVFKKQNSLPENKVLYWLATNTNTFWNDGITLDMEVQDDIKEKIIDGKLEYFSIPPTFITPYLKFSRDIERKINSIKLPEAKLERNGEKNAQFIFNLIEKSYLQQRGFKEAILDFFKRGPYTGKRRTLIDTEKVNLTMTNVDNYPQVEIKLQTIIQNKVIPETEIDFSYFCYGMRNPYAYFSFRKLYGLGILRYFQLFDSLDENLNRSIPFFLYKNNLIDVIQYNTAIQNSGEIGSIVNLPALLFKSLNINNYESELAKLTSSLKAPSLGIGVHSKAVKYLFEHDNKLNPNLVKLLYSSNLRLEDVGAGSLDMVPQEISDLVGFPALRPETFSFLSMAALDFYMKAASIDSTGMSKTVKEEILLNFFSSNPEGAQASLVALGFLEALSAAPEKCSYSLPRNKANNHFCYEFYCALRGVKLTIAHQGACTICDIYTTVACTLVDYGLPSMDNKQPYSYPVNLLFFLDMTMERLTPVDPTQVQSSAETRQKEQFFEGLSDVLGIKERILDQKMLTKILERGYIYPLPIKSSVLSRDKLWKTLGEKKFMMMALYQNQSLDVIGFRNMTNPLLASEQMVVDYEPTTLKSLMNSLGMITPFGMSDLDYFKYCLPLYVQIFNRGPTWNIKDHLKPKTIEELELFCDSEITDFILGGYVGHTSRSELLQRAMDYVNGEEMFVLLKDNEDADLNDESKINEQTDRNEIIYGMCRAPTRNPLNILFQFTESKANGGAVHVMTISELAILNQNTITQASSDIDTRTEEEKKADMSAKVDDGIKMTPLSVYAAKTVVKDKIEVPIPYTMERKSKDLFVAVLNYTRMYFDNFVASIREKYLPDLGENYETKSVVDDDSNTGICKESHEFLNGLIKRIDDLEYRSRQIEARDKQTVEQFLLLRPDVRTVYVDGLLTIFDCGMMQRQWTGDRRIYPYSFEETKTEEEFKHKKDKVVGDQLAKLRGIMERLDKMDAKAGDLFRKTTIMDLASKTEEKFNPELVEFVSPEGREVMEGLAPRTFYDVFNQMEAGEYCIRMSSSKFIVTAYYWLKLFGNVSVLGDFYILKMRDIF